MVDEKKKNVRFSSYPVTVDVGHNFRKLDAFLHTTKKIFKTQHLD